MKESERDPAMFAIIEQTKVFVEAKVRDRAGIETYNVLS